MSSRSRGATTLAIAGWGEKDLGSGESEGVTLLFVLRNCSEMSTLRQRRRFDPLSFVASRFQVFSQNFFWIVFDSCSMQMSSNSLFYLAQINNSKNWMHSNSDV
jgi:hypothetical protein